jgi:penicillin-binding protein
VEVSFIPSPDNDLERYRVFRATGGGPFVPVGELPASERLFSDKNVVRGQSYVYQITALDRAGNESAPSKPAECQLP